MLTQSAIKCSKLLWTCCFTEISLQQEVILWAYLMARGDIRVVLIREGTTCASRTPTASALYELETADMGFVH